MILNEEFIHHYFEQYNDPKYPPSWMLMECLSFGKVTSLFRNLAKLKDKNESISPGSAWRERLYQLFEKYSNDIPFNLMGFLDNWKDDPFWEI